MLPTMMVAMKHMPLAHDPFRPMFWFVMSMSLLVGFVVAYPMNWWLVSRHLKHGMMTMRASERQVGHQQQEGEVTQKPVSSVTAQRGFMRVSGIFCRLTC
jgi:hypothetical protein